MAIDEHDGMRADEEANMEEVTSEEMAGDDQSAAAQRYQNDFHESLDSTDQIGDPELMDEAERDYEGKATKPSEQAKPATEQPKSDTSS